MESSEIAINLVDNYIDSPFITKEVLKKHIECALDKVKNESRRAGQKEMENIFVEFCKRNNLPIYDINKKAQE